MAVALGGHGVRVGSEQLAGLMADAEGQVTRMSRQAQNVLMGVIACVVVAVAMAAVALSLAGGDGSTAAGIDPLPPSGGTTSGSGDEAALLPSSSIVPPAALAVTEDQETTTTILATSTTAPAATTTAAPITTVAATVATTAPAATTAPSTSEAPSTSAGESTSTSDSNTGSSSMPDSPSTTAAGDDTTTTSGPVTTAEQTTTTVEAPAPVDLPNADSLNAVELEIARLTNQLRTDPNGSLKREGAAIDCGGRVGVDLASGQYTAIAALTVDQAASLQVARPWSAQMTTNNFVHQDRAGITALQAAGITVRAAGENIAYHNFSDKALSHFEGWRESDGHFCNMMDPNFTHIGVGEVTKTDGISYATQNFFSTR